MNPELIKELRKATLQELSPEFKDALTLIIKKLETDSVSNANEAARMLSGFWGLCVEKLDIRAVSADPAAMGALFILSLYFHHRGDWAAMRGDLT